MTIVPSTDVSLICHRQSQKVLLCTRTKIVVSGDFSCFFIYLTVGYTPYCKWRFPGCEPEVVWLYKHTI